MFQWAEFLFLFPLSKLFKIDGTPWHFYTPYDILCILGSFFSLLGFYFHFLGKQLKDTRKKWIPETPKELPEGLNQNQMCKLVQHDNFWQNLLIEIMVSTDKDSDLLFGQATLTKQKQRHLEI